MACLRIHRARRLNETPAPRMRLSLGVRTGDEGSCVNSARGRASYNLPSSRTSPFSPLTASPSLFLPPGPCLATLPVRAAVRAFP